MKFIATINDTQVVMTPQQVEILAGMLSGTPTIERKWLGSGKGPNGTDSIDLLGTFALRTSFKLAPLPDDEFDALKLVTEAQKGK